MVQSVTIDYDLNLLGNTSQFHLPPTRALTDQGATYRHLAAIRRMVFVTNNAARWRGDQRQVTLTSNYTRLLHQAYLQAPRRDGGVQGVRIRAAICVGVYFIYLQGVYNQEVVRCTRVLGCDGARCLGNCSQLLAETHQGFEPIRSALHVVCCLVLL